MFKRFSLVFLTLIMAIVVVLFAAKYPTGPNTVSYDELVGLWISIGIIVVLFLPPLIMAFFSHIAVRIISGIYQMFALFSFIISILVAFFVSGGFDLLIVSVIGTIVCLVSIVVTFVVGYQRKLSY